MDDDLSKLLDKVGRDLAGPFLIDTCYNFLGPYYETAVRKGCGHWIVVARYETREEAADGHLNLLAALFKAIESGCMPEFAYSVQTNKYEKY